MLRTLARLQEVCRTENDVLLFTASGSGAFESAVVNLLSPGERVLAVMAGEFGERWADLAKAYGVDVHELRYAWGETPRADDLRTRLDETGAKVAFVVHSETSTGVVSDVQALAQAARDAGALVVVDAVSSLGAVPLETDNWGLDVVIAGSQKALMTHQDSRRRSRCGLEPLAEAAPAVLRLERMRMLEPGRHLPPAVTVALGVPSACASGGSSGRVRSPRGAWSGVS
jgi:hypothetical protein